MIHRSYTRCRLIYQSQHMVEMKSDVVRRILTCHFKFVALGLRSWSLCNIHESASVHQTHSVKKNEHFRPEFVHVHDNRPIPAIRKVSHYLSDRKRCSAVKQNVGPIVHE